MMQMNKDVLSLFSPHKRQESAHKIRRILAVALRLIMLLAFSYILLYPLFYMLSTSIKGSADYIDPTVVWIPKEVSFESFHIAAQALNFGKSLYNTLSLEMVAATIEIAACAVAAYGLARFDFKEKKFLMFCLLLTILIPEQVLVIPKVLNFQSLDVFGILKGISHIIGTDIRPNILGTPLTFYLPSLMANGLRGGLFIYIYIQFFKGLPRELEEASWIDGAGPWRTFLCIIVPSSGVVILTNAIFALVWHWNDYYTAIMYAADNYPLAVSLSNIFSLMENIGIDRHANIATGIVMSACLLFIAIPLAVYMVLQKHFIQSIDRIGIVG